MYENKTFETILNNMLTYVKSKDPSVDIREGSLIYTALAPIALELETAYHESDMILDETFVGTASKQYLVEHGNQSGVPLNEATYGHFKGEFNVDVEIGSRFNLDKFNYTVLEKLSDPTEGNEYYTFELICETSGSEPNDYLGDLTPITFVDNLLHAKLTSVITYGEDEEETEEYRYRIQTHSNNPPINGNIAQYNEWLESYPGIGKYKVIPCWNGQNTVKLTVLNPENEKASDKLITQVQKDFDPPEGEINDDVNTENYPQGRGMGNGVAPIGAIITVDTVVEIPVKVECTVILKDGYTSPMGVKEAVNEYLKSTILEKFTIDYMAISAKIYAAESVDSVTNLKVTIKNTVMDKELSPFIDTVTLNNNEIPVLDEENSVWGV